MPPSRIKAFPSRTKETGLDFLGFFRPIRGFSMGYEQSKSKKPRVRFRQALRGRADGERNGAARQLDSRLCPSGLRHARRAPHRRQATPGGAASTEPDARPLAERPTEQIKNKRDLVKTFSQRRGSAVALRGFFEDRRRRRRPP